MSDEVKTDDMIIKELIELNTNLTEELNNLTKIVTLLEDIIGQKNSLNHTLQENVDRLERVLDDFLDSNTYNTYQH